MTTPGTTVVQYPVVSLKADWNRDGYLSVYADLSRLTSSVSVERSITGDLPAEVGLVEGYSAAQLTATLEGFFFDDTDALNAFAPYRVDSPLYGTQFLTAPIVCDMGLGTDTGPVMVRQFTGHIRSVRVDSAQRTVVITALDDADRLRASITLPAYGQLRSDWISHGYKFNINSQAIIDYVLRRNGIYASPPAVATAQLSITGHGWMVAELGRSMFPTGYCGTIPDVSWWVPGPFNMLAVRGLWQGGHAVTVENYTQDSFAPTAGNGMGVGMWVNIGNDLNLPLAFSNRKLVELFPTSSGAGSVYFDIRADWTPGTMTVTAESNNYNTTVASVTTSITQSLRWIYIGAHFQFGTNGTTLISFRVNGTTTTATGTTPSSYAYLRDQMQVITHTDARDWSNLQVWYDYNPPATWPGETWTPQANIGVGYNHLSHLPDVVNADSWQVIRDVTTAEYGISGFSTTGVFSFTPRTSPPDPTTIAKTITSDRALLDLTLETNSDAVRNVVTTDTTAAYLTPASIVESKDVTTWESPVGTRVYKVILPYGGFGPVEVQPVTQYTTTAWDAKKDLLEGFVAVQAAAPDVEVPSTPNRSLYVHFEHTNDLFALQQVPPTSLTTYTATPTGNRVGLLKVQNNYTAPIRFATTSGSPALRVAGWVLNQEPNDTETITNPGSVTVLGTRVFSVPTSPYRQLIAPMRAVATQLLTALSNPLPVVDSMSVVGDPAVQLTNTVRVTDSQGHGSFRATIVRIVRAFSTTTGLLDTLTVRPIAPPGLGITDDLELGLADSTLIAAP